MLMRNTVCTGKGTGNRRAECYKKGSWEQQITPHRRHLTVNTGLSHRGQHAGNFDVHDVSITPLGEQTL